MYLTNMRIVFIADAQDPESGEILLYLQMTSMSWAKCN